MARRGVLITVAAVLVALLGCTAFAASSLLQMNSGPTSFFKQDHSLEIYGSLKSGIDNLNASVGQSEECAMGNVTLDTVSSDRNIINLFLTLDPKEGVNLKPDNDDGVSHQSDWEHLESLVPRMRYHLMSDGKELCTGTVHQLDAYTEDNKIRFLQRIVPLQVLPEQVELKLDYCYRNDSGQDAWANFDVGLDLSTAPTPRDVGSQELTFSTNQGEKTFAIQRFTSSELGTVMVARNDSTYAFDDSFCPPETSLRPNLLKITDDKGNVLQPVWAGDGLGVDEKAPYVFEYSGITPDVQSVTFTPIVMTQGHHFGEPSGQGQVDVSQPGTKIATSEYGGYEIENWKVENTTVTIRLKPYGWAGADHLSLSPVFLEPPAFEDRSNSVFKWDYLSGELVQIDSYRHEVPFDLSDIHRYNYGSYAGQYDEQDAAALSLALQGGENAS